MTEIVLPFNDTAAAWRRAAGTLAAALVQPHQVTWIVADGPAPRPDLPRAAFKIKVPERFIHLSDAIALHENADRFDKLYALLWRLRLNPAIIKDSADPALADLERMEEQVARAARKLRSHLAFHPMPGRMARKRFAGWVDVPHDALPLALPHLVRRYGDWDWTIHTPFRTAHFVAGHVVMVPPPPRPSLPKDKGDPFWAAWLSSPCARAVRVKPAPESLLIAAE